jgi:hypothetical protein
MEQIDMKARGNRSEASRTEQSMSSSLELRRVIGLEALATRLC